MNTQLQIRAMESHDVTTIFETFKAHRINKPVEYLQQCWEENVSGVRVTLLAFYENKFAGSLNLLATSHYPSFVQLGIPEINDFNVIPTLRQHKIGTALMDAIEIVAFEKYEAVGIGVGMTPSYGPAQRLYAKRGYIPDGKGLIDVDKPVELGSTVTISHDLALYMTKERGN
jgi:GNAT superfamily N-acetyltransferase